MRRVRDAQVRSPIEIFDAIVSAYRRPHSHVDPDAPTSSASSRSASSTASRSPVRSTSRSDRRDAERRRRRVRNGRSITCRVEQRWTIACSSAARATATTTSSVVVTMPRLPAYASSGSGDVSIDQVKGDDLRMYEQRSGDLVGRRHRRRDAKLRGFGLRRHPRRQGPRSRSVKCD